MSDYKDLDPNSNEYIDKKITEWYNSSIRNEDKGNDINLIESDHKVIEERKNINKEEHVYHSELERDALKRVDDWFNGNLESNKSYNSEDLMNDIRFEYFGGVPFGVEPQKATTSNNSDEPKSGFGGR